MDTYTQVSSLIVDAHVEDAIKLLIHRKHRLALVAQLGTEIADRLEQIVLEQPTVELRRALLTAKLMDLALDGYSRGALRYSKQLCQLLDWQGDSSILLPCKRLARIVQAVLAAEVDEPGPH